MQGFAFAPKRLWRYSKTVSTTDEGVAVETFTKSAKPRWMNLIPNTSSRMRNDYGISEDVTYLIVINDCDEFTIGDRIGTETEILYEVISLQTFATNQQLTVRECRTTA